MEIDFLQIAAAIFVLSCASLTVILCLAKWRAFELYELHRPRWAPPYVCVFCLSFWISFLILAALYLARPFDLVLFIAPFASASLTRLAYEDFEFKRR
jgi:hypothetical protein